MTFTFVKVCLLLLRIYFVFLLFFFLYHPLLFTTTRLLTVINGRYSRFRTCFLRAKLVSVSVRQVSPRYFVTIILYCGGHMSFRLSRVRPLCWPHTALAPYRQVSAFPSMKTVSLCGFASHTAQRISFFYYCCPLKLKMAKTSYPKPCKIELRAYSFKK